MTQKRDMTLPIALATLLALLVWPARAAIVVDGDNASGVEDGTWEHPFRLISSGMNVASFGDTVFVLPGLGRLVRVERKARMGRNPATGKAIKIPAKKVVKFRVAKAVKDAIVPPKKK